MFFLSLRLIPRFFFRENVAAFARLFMGVFIGGEEPLIEIFTCPGTIIGAGNTIVRCFPVAQALGCGIEKLQAIFSFGIESVSFRAHCSSLALSSEFFSRHSIEVAVRAAIH